MCGLLTLHVLWSYVVNAWGYGSAGPWMGGCKGGNKWGRGGVGDREVIWVVVVVVKGDPREGGQGWVGNQVEEPVISDI